ncbi:2-octaprenyl-3-methyl-6-methoxy-1,4-benzoquinol hydroxylase [Citrobacter koseri]|uniref:2-octaprenyl-3-methyl-6-methoxy-1,4-benzoquinol hydroxylase n=1 Tax=Citrobacter koseri TaxID=545 RepID=A0A2X2V3G6_CITKO|nr:2-octaprenyl-3-methyl-6-methoxy-1,4-benzoquinol hydroxylase [Citrobacter koseri]
MARSGASHQVLKRYQTRRMADNFIMQSGMDLFYAGFSNNLQPLRIMRNIGLMAAERAGVLKRQAPEICVRVVGCSVPDSVALIRPTPATRRAKTEKQKARRSELF